MPKAPSSTPKSLLISRKSPASSSPKCALNVLPCQIDHTGPVDASSRYWQPSVDPGNGETCTSYFRGRRLRGREIMIPRGYEGVVLKKTDRSEVLAEDMPVDDRDEENHMPVKEGEEAREVLQVVEHVAGFNSITVWNHEILSDQLEDVYVRGVSEWTALAGAVSKLTFLTQYSVDMKQIHDYGEDEESSHSGT
jgi:ribonuclease H2 subunit C